jgi:UDP-N-acetylglucosamine--N-acetylmuramyl-(pentapeptide) pyrophosphoryl-undecaprenol N-acetylglucosamine transferase
MPASGYGHTLLDVVGLQRSLSRRNLAFVPKLVASTFRARALLRSLRPAVVVNVGGYASMPATLAARVLRIPVVVVSYDRRPGLASKLTARFAAATAAAFAGSPLPRATTTGAPIRPEIIAVDRQRDRDSARAALGVPEGRFVVTVFGGSLGAKAINDAVQGLVETWKDRTDICIHHVVGERWVASIGATARSGADGIMYTVVGYEDSMARLYAASDLMVTRAGASTIAELAATGTPAVVIPWPDAADNHQLDNARTLSDCGAAVLLEQSNLDAAALAQIIDGLRSDDTRRAAIAAAAHAEGARHRDDSLIRLIESVAAR